jgi:hypothetical protein
VGVLAPPGRAVQSLGIRVTVLAASFGVHSRGSPIGSLRVPKVRLALENPSWRQVRVSLSGPSIPRTETLDEKLTRQVRSWWSGPAPAPSARLGRREIQVPKGSRVVETLTMIGLPRTRWVAIVVQLPRPRGTARVAFIVAAPRTARPLLGLRGIR